ncbi:MAG: hypothetical protein AAB614_02100 [Patescibacteria group bacterium]
MIKKNNLNKGFGLVEIIMGVSIAIIVFLSIGQVMILSLKVSSDKDLKLRALNLAKEGIEVVRNIRDDGWTSRITTLTSGTTYYVATSTNQWILTTLNPGLIENNFTRTVTVSNVARDGNFNIVTSGGVNDPGTKKVTSTVYWNGTAKNIQLVAYIANILND